MYPQNLAHESVLRDLKGKYTGGVVKAAHTTNDFISLPLEIKVTSVVVYTSYNVYISLKLTFVK